MSLWASKRDEAGWAWMAVARRVGRRRVRSMMGSGWGEVRRL